MTTAPSEHERELRGLQAEAIERAREMHEREQRHEALIARLRSEAGVREHQLKPRKAISPTNLCAPAPSSAIPDAACPRSSARVASESEHGAVARARSGRAAIATAGAPASAAYAWMRQCSDGHVTAALGTQREHTGVWSKSARDSETGEDGLTATFACSGRLPAAA